MPAPDILERLRGYNPPDRCSDKMQSQIARDIAEGAEEIGFLRREVERLQLKIMILEKLRANDQDAARGRNEPDKIDIAIDVDGQKQAVLDLVTGAADTFERLREPNFQPLNDAEKDSFERPVPRDAAGLCLPWCEECFVNKADPPSKLCPGCQAYREHQA